MSWRKHGLLASIEARQIGDLVARNRSRIIDVIQDTYSAFYSGQCVNPDTYRLQFADKPSCRINALPAYVGGITDLAGLKWVASFPQNVEKNLLRATAIIILNCGETGYPVALLDGTQISAARPAASTALAARLLRPKKVCDELRVFGAGIINREVIDFLVDDGWRIEQVEIVDPAEEGRQALLAHCMMRGLNAMSAEDDDAGTQADLISFATSALTPWYDRAICRDEIILHISLRDIVPSRLLNVRNIVDDIDHALKANTSLHLLEQEVGRTFHVETTVV